MARHGFCTSVYFSGPEGLTLEFATDDTAEHPLDHNKTWIDPEVVALPGISAEDLKRYTNPPAYKGEGGAVAQPPYDETKPQPAGESMSLEMYKAMLLAPDEAVGAAMNETTPPNLA